MSDVVYSENMGCLLSKTPKRHVSNRVSSTDNIGNNHPEINQGSEEEIKVPDATTKHKKSRSLLQRPFAKKSFVSIRKTSSLQSAVYQKITIADIENLKKENSDLKQEKEKTSMAHRDEIQRMKDEATRLFSENKALTNALRKLQTDLDKAQLTEKDAVERANAFEQEREKIQRQFKIFREAKEEEMSTILKEKQNLVTLLRRHIGNDGSIQDFLMESVDLRHAQSINEWLMDGHSGSESYVGHPQEEGRWKHSIISDDHRSKKEICTAIQTVLHSLHHSGHGVPLNNVYSVYLTSAREMKSIAESVIAGCQGLMWRLEGEGVVLSLTHFLNGQMVKLDKSEEEANHFFFAKADIVVVFLDGDILDTSLLKMVKEVIDQHKICVVASVQEFNSEMFAGLGSSQRVRFVHGNGEKEALVSACVDECSAICEMFYSKQQYQRQFQRIVGRSDYREHAYQSYDSMGLSEQQQLQKMCLRKNTGAINSKDFESEIATLNAHITQDGPAMPLLVTSPPGSGKSSLLSYWIATMQDSLPNSCILYHTAIVQSACSRDPLHIIRRFLYMLLDQLPMFFNLQDIEKDFPRWLDHACSKYSNGVVIIIDSADLIYNNRECFKWLLDPLPVPVRVVISVSSSNHPKQWSTWNKLELAFDLEKTIRLCNSSLKATQFNKGTEGLLLSMLQEKTFLSRLSNHLFRRLVFVVLSLVMSENEAKDISNSLMKCESIVDVFMIVLGVLETRHPLILVQSVLSFIYLTSNGLSYMELHELHDDPDLYVLLFDLNNCCMVTEVCGLYKIISVQGREAIALRYGLDEKYNNRVNGLRSNLVHTFAAKLQHDCVSYRTADELPDLLMALEEMDKLRMCMKNIHIFTHLYHRGRHCAVVNMWKTLGVELTGIHREYMDTLNQMERNSEYNFQITLYFDMLGEFFKDFGQYKYAQLAFEKSLELKETHVEPEDITLQHSYFCLGKLFTQWKNFQTAEYYLTQALEVKDRSSVNEQQPQRSITHVFILEAFAALYMMQEKPKDADRCRKEAVSIRENDFKQRGIVYITSALNECTEIVAALMHNEVFKREAVTEWLISIAQIHFNLKNYQEATEVLQHALQYHENDVEHEQDHQAVADIMVKLSYVYTTVGQNSKAEGMLEKALMMYFQLNLLEEPNLNLVIHSLVRLYKSQQRLSDLERLHRSHFEALERAFGADDTRVGDAMNALAVHLSKTGKVEEALALFERAIHVFTKRFGFENARVSDVLSNLAMLFYEQNNAAQAAYYYKLSMDSQRTADQLKFK